MNLVALVLAAGSARRFGSDKLSAPFQGVPLIHHAIRAARAAPVGKVIVVARPGLDIGTWQGEPRVEILPLESTALSLSLKTGIAAASKADGAFVFLGDMPSIPAGMANRLAAVLGTGYAALPCKEGRPGHPVLLSARAFADISALSGDEGAGRLLRSRTDIVFVECDEPGIHFDIDRPQYLFQA